MISVRWPAGHTNELPTIIPSDTSHVKPAKCKWYGINDKRLTIPERLHTWPLYKNISVEREKSFAWLKGLLNPAWEKSYTTEYRTINAGEMFACWVAHDNLHLRHVVELRRLRLENITQPYNLEYAGDW